MYNIQTLNKILSVITGKPILTGKHISMLPGPLLSTLALCQVSSATRRDGQRGSQMTGHSHSPHTSRTHLHNPLLMVSGQVPIKWGGPKTATALPLYKKPSVSNFCSLLIVLKCTAFFVTHSWYLCPSLWEGEQQFLCFQVTKTFLRGKKKIGIIFPKLNKGGANTSSNCGCFSFTYLPSQENNLSST